jgi:uncharacterized protein
VGVFSYQVVYTYAKSKEPDYYQECKYHSKCHIKVIILAYQNKLKKLEYPKDNVESYLCNNPGFETAACVIRNGTASFSVFISAIFILWLILL